MPKAAIAPIIKTLVAATTHTSTEASVAFSMPLSDTYCLAFKLGTVSGTSPTVDIVLQTSVDKGTTYINLPMRSAQLSTTGTYSIMTFKLGLGGNEVATEGQNAATGGTAIKNCVFDPQYMKAYFTIAGTSPSFPVTIYGLFTPLGSQSPL